MNTPRKSKSDARLTKNQSLVLNTLLAADKPLTAYSILDALRDRGLKAPLQVYRAISKLLEIGVIHRLDSLNAFVPCQLDSSNCNIEKTVIFAICLECGKAQEVSDPLTVDAIQNISRNTNFRLENSVTEIRGLCANC